MTKKQKEDMKQKKIKRDKIKELEARIANLELIVFRQDRLLSNQYCTCQYTTGCPVHSTTWIG